MRRTFLLGATKNNIILGEFEVYKDNRFAASFDVGQLFYADDIDEDYMKNYFQDLWDGLDDATKLDYLEDGDITRDDWIQSHIDSTYYDDVVDCSCTYLQLDTKNGLVNFETISCGQHNIKEDEFYNDIVFTNKEVVLELLDMWEQYHLKEFTTEQVNRLNELLDKLEPYDYDTNVENVKEFVLGVVDNEEEANVN